MREVEAEKPVNLGRLILASALGVLSIVVLDLAISGGVAAPAFELLAQTLGFGALIAFLLAGLLFCSTAILERGGRRVSLCATLVWSPFLYILARDTLAGRRMQELLPAGLLVPVLACVLIIALHIALLAIWRGRRRRPRLTLVVLGSAAILFHLVDRSVLVGLYPVQHAACGLAAFALASLLWDQILRLRLAARTTTIVVLLVLAAGIAHLATLRGASMSVRAALISARGLSSTVGLARHLPYRRADAVDELPTAYSRRHRDEIEARASAMEKLDAIRPDEALDLLVLSIDALRADHCSLHGYERPTTPFLRKLAGSSFVFEEARSATTSSFLSIHAMLSGAYPSSLVMRELARPEFLSTALQRAGWATHAYRPDVMFPITPPGWPEPDRKLGFQNCHAVPNAARDLVPRILEDLDRAAGPAFVFAHMMDPHHPYQKHAAHDFGDRRIDRYDSEIAQVDAELERLFDELERRGRLERLVLVITADHGEAFGEHREFMHGGMPYEEQVHVPLLIRLPFAPQGRRIAGPVSLASLAPTLLDVLGLPELENAEARSLIPLFFEERDPTTEVAFVERPVLYDWTGQSPMVGVLRGRWKLLLDLEADVAELFDLAADPGERQDRHADEPEVAAELRALHQTWRQDRRLLRERERSTAGLIDEVAAALGAGTNDAQERLDALLADPRSRLREAGIAMALTELRAGRSTLLDFARLKCRHPDFLARSLATILRELLNSADDNAGLPSSLAGCTAPARAAFARAIWLNRDLRASAAIAANWLEGVDDLTTRVDLVATIVTGDPRPATAKELLAMSASCAPATRDRVATTIAELPDEIVAATLEGLILAEDAVFTRRIIERLGRRDSRFRREAVERILRLRDLNFGSSAMKALEGFPADDWRQEILLACLKHGRDRATRLEAAGQLASLEPDDMPAVFADALLAYPDHRLALARIVHERWPEAFAETEAFVDHLDEELRSGARHTLGDDADATGLEIVIVASGAITGQAGDRIVIHDAHDARLFDIPLRSDLEMARCVLSTLDTEATGPFRLEVVSEDRPAGQHFGRLRAVLLRGRDPLSLWQQDIDTTEEVAILSRFDSAWETSAFLSDRVFLCESRGQVHSWGHAASRETLEVSLVGGASASEIEVHLNGSPLGRVALAPTERKTITFRDIAPLYRPDAPNTVSLDLLDLDPSTLNHAVPESAPALTHLLWH